MNITVPKPAKLALAVFASLLLLLLAAGGALFGLLHSEAGAKFLARQAQSTLEGLVDWQAMSGSLMGPLELRGVTVSQPGLTLEAQSLSLDWQPAQLLRGELQIDALEASGLQLTLAQSESPPSTEPFLPSTLQLPVGVSLKRLTLRDLQLVQPGQPPLVIDSIEIRGQLRNGELALEQLRASLPQGELELRGSAGLEDEMPVDLQLRWQGALPVAELTSTPNHGVDLAAELNLKGNIHWSETIGFNLAYEMDIRGLEGLAPDLPPELNATGLLQGQQSADQLDLEQVTLNFTATDMALALQGQVLQLSSAAPRFSTGLQWTGLQWPLSDPEPLVRSTRGSLKLAGSADAYELTLDAALAGTDIPQSEWQGRGRGNLESLELEQLQGSLLEGAVSLSGPVGWDPVPRWDLQITGSGLNPELLVADIPGELALNAATRGELDAAKGLLAEVQVKQLSGTLLDYPVDLKAQASVAGEVIQLASLDLDSDGNRLHASGTVAPAQMALEWQLDAANPATFVAGASGNLTARGSLDGSPDSPRLGATVQGTALQLETLSVSTLTATVTAGTGPQDELHIDLSTGPLQDGEQTLLQALRLETRGSNSSHRISLQVDAGEEHLRAALQGGLSDEMDAWQGQLAQLEVSSKQYGLWRLAQTAPLALSASEASLGNSCLRRDGDSAQLCAGGNWSATDQSTLVAKLEALPLESLLPQVSSEVSGAVDASLAADGTLMVVSEVRLSPGQFSVELDQGLQQLTHDGGHLVLTVNDKGLSATLELAAPENGNVAANVQMPSLTALPLAGAQPLQGSVRATLPDLGGLAAWVPELGSSAGRLEADLQLAGSTEQPQVKGHLTLSEGAADIPMAGLSLQQIELRAISNPAQVGQLLISGAMNSGPGSIELSGQADLLDNNATLAIQGNDLQIFNTPDARVLLSPELQMGWAEDLLTLRGHLQVPSADITPKLALSPAVAAQDAQAAPEPGQVIAPSPDVVVINGTLEQAVTSVELQAPFRIDSQVLVTLGDKINVNAVGFISRITGGVLFTNTPEQADLMPMARGMFAVKDGTFRSFGQDLDIETGQLIFANVPADQPEINLRAVRWIDNDPTVSAAGVLVTGPATEPSLELFSRPQLEPSEIQSYLLTGRSSGSKNNVLSIGTYVTRRLYVGYGYNLLEKTSEFNSLFSITPRYGAGVSVGEADNNLNATFTYER
jgi:translocation and assembly module TamB